MFTGIIEFLGTVATVHEEGSNRVFRIESTLANELKIDQSLSHDGICLTVEEIISSQHRVTAIQETLEKTNVGQWKTGTVVNLERCMMLNGRLDGHLVQGHVDCTATCLAISRKNGSAEYQFRIPATFTGLIVEKGSITVNGISLTLFNVGVDTFTVAIIPYTLAHTNMQYLQENDMVNIEFDMVGKYINRLIQPLMAEK